MELSFYEETLYSKLAFASEAEFELKSAKIRTLSDTWQSLINQLIVMREAGGVWNQPEKRWEFDLGDNKRYFYHVKSGTQEWYKNAVLHRDDGPAVHYRGCDIYYLEGVKMSQYDFKSRRKK
jgi:hypothetical protein